MDKHNGIGMDMTNNGGSGVGGGVGGVGGFGCGGDTLGKDCGLVDGSDGMTFQVGRIGAKLSRSFRMRPKRTDCIETSSG